MLYDASNIFQTVLHLLFLYCFFTFVLASRLPLSALLLIYLLGFNAFFLIAVWSLLCLNIFICCLYFGLAARCWLLLFGLDVPDLVNELVVLEGVGEGFLKPVPNIQHFYLGEDTLHSCTVENLELLGRNTLILVHRVRPQQLRGRALGFVHRDVCQRREVIVTVQIADRR